MATPGYAGQISTKVSDYTAKGSKEAQRHRPATDATHPDANEVSLRTDTDRWLASEQQTFGQALTDSEKTSADIQRKLIDLDADAQLALADNSLASSIDAELASDRKKLVTLTEERIKAEVDFRAFRAENSITDMPTYPSSKIYHFSLLVGFALLETFGNAVFYQNEGGLIGGFVVALVVSGLNLGSAAMLGIGFRYKNIKDPVFKIAGWASLPLFLVLSVYFNSLFAAFRSEYQMLDDPSSPSELSSAFRSASENAANVFVLRLHIADLMSFLLFGLGILLSIFAFYKGYSSDDKYPGHRSKDLRLKSQMLKEAELQELTKQRLKDFLLGRRAHLQSLASQPTVLGALITGAIAKTQHAAVTLKNDAESIVRDYLLVLDAYRQANVAIRGIEPPAYFSSVPDMSQQVASPDISMTLTRLESVKSELESYRARYQNPLSDKQNELQTDMARVLSETYNDYLKAIDNEAQDNIQRSVVIFKPVQN